LIVERITPIGKICAARLLVFEGTIFCLLRNVLFVKLDL
jgi:hypothetical protein